MHLQFWLRDPVKFHEWLEVVWWGPEINTKPTCEQQKLPYSIIYKARRQKKFLRAWQVNRNKLLIYVQTSSSSYSSSSSSSSLPLFFWYDTIMQLDILGEQFTVHVPQVADFLCSRRVTLKILLYPHCLQMNWMTLELIQGCLEEKGCCCPQAAQALFEFAVQPIVLRILSGEYVLRWGFQSFKIDLLYGEGTTRTNPTEILLARETAQFNPFTPRIQKVYSPNLW